LFEASDICDTLDTSLTLVRTLGNTSIENTTVYQCLSCNKTAYEKTIQCNTCTRWYHFSWTQLSKYQLYVYYTTHRKYTYQKCVETIALALNIQTLTTEKVCTSAQTQTLQKSHASVQTQNP